MTEPRDYCTPPLPWWCWLTLFGAVIFLAWLLTK